MKKYLVNAFSIQMLSGSATLRFEEVESADVPSDVISAVGHADTAVVLSDLLGFSVPMNRINIALDENTELYVAQLVGGRLPEGSTTLPDGYSFKFYRVTTLWDTYHLQKLTEEEYGNVKEVIYRYLDKLEEISESDWIKNWLIENEELGS